MGRPRKRRAVAVDSQRTNPVTQIPTPLPIQFDFSDLGMDQILQPVDWNAIAFPADVFPPDWSPLLTDMSVAQWTPQLRPPTPLAASTADPSIIPSFPSVSTHTQPTLPQTSTLPTTCACLSTLYLTLSSLQSLSPTFPLALPALRSAMDAVRRMINCQTCSPPIPTAPLLPTQLPNTMLLAALIPQITVHYSRLVAFINEEAASGAVKTLRVGEMGNTMLDAHHTGDGNCPVAVEVEMGAEEWRKMMRGVVRKDLMGADGKGGLVELVRLMGERQKLWHERAVERGCGWGGSKARVPDGEVPNCLKIVEMTRLSVEMVDACQ